MSNITERLRELQQSKTSTTTAPATESSEDLRKARTRRLIQLGALTDQYLGTASLEPEDAAELLNQLAQLPEVKGILPK